MFSALILSRTSEAWHPLPGASLRFRLRFAATLRLQLGAGSGLPSAVLFCSCQLVHVDPKSAEAHPIFHNHPLKQIFFTFLQAPREVRCEGAQVGGTMAAPTSPVRIQHLTVDCLILSNVDRDFDSYFYSLDLLYHFIPAPKLYAKLIQLPIVQWLLSFRSCRGAIRSGKTRQQPNGKESGEENACDFGRLHDRGSYHRCYWLL